MTKETKPIGIVTYHDGYNFGAYLQVYALQSVITSLGFSSEILNYKNKKFWKNEYLCLFGTKRPSLFVNNIKKWIAFKKAHKLLKMSKFSSNPKVFNAINFKAIIYGSDEIWNYENPLLGLDTFYFGSEMDQTPKIAYAPSFGSLSKDILLPCQIKTLLNSFDNLSVRDYNSRSILNKQLDVQIPIVLDPTLLNDFSLTTPKCKESNFILVYTTGFSPEEEASIRSFANLKGKKLVSVGYRNSFCDKNIIGISPFEFLSYYSAADYIFTSMFHGTIFAIKAEKNFVILVDEYRTNKLAHIIDILGLQDRITNAADISRVMSIPINYKKIKKILGNEIKSSVQYLANALRNK